MDLAIIFLSIILASQEHLSTRELFLAAVPLYVSLCDFFIVIAPPTAHDGIEVDMSTHFRQGSSFCMGGEGGVVLRWMRSCSVPFIGFLQFLRVVFVCFGAFLVIRLVQGRAAGEGRWIRRSEVACLRILQRLTSAGHLRNGARDRPQRLLG